MSEIIDDEVDAIRANTIANNSRVLYRRSAIKFILWIYNTKNHLISDHFNNLVLEEGSINEGLIKKVLNDTPNNPILKFDLLEARDFISWIVTIRKTDGEKPHYSTYNSHRSGLYNLYRDYHITMGKKLSDELTHYYRGLKRRSVREISNGSSGIKSVKDALSFSAYRFICMHMMKSGEVQYIFSCSFTAIC